MDQERPAGQPAAPHVSAASGADGGSASDVREGASPGLSQGRAVPAWLTRRLVAALALAFAILCAGAVIYGAGAIAERRTLADLDAQARNGLPLASAALRAEIEKHTALPLILAQDAAVAALLEQPDAIRVAQLNARLLDLARATRANVIYVMDRSGLTLASSNFMEETSFIGVNYGFRHYFSGAMESGRADQFALGTVSGKPGLYLSQRVEAPGEALGVVVVKLELDTVEEDWRHSGRPTFVADDRGIVLASSVPAWRFHTLRPLTAREADEIRDSLQFGTAPLTPLDLTPVRGADLVETDEGAGRRRYVEASAEVQGHPAGWRIFVLVPADRVLSSAVLSARVIAALAMLIVSAIAGLLWQRRRREAGRRAELARTARQLEARVRARTAELSAANDRLREEITERAAAEARVLRLRDDLAQANRLASLGQITAGVAHEINQPLAAIRTYAENAGRFLDRQDAARAAGNLASVIALTERIGAITHTLRSFARRQRGRSEVLDLEEPIEGAVLMLGTRLKEAGVTLERIRADRPLLVRANRIRLEQVLVNLLRNAMDAMADTPAPRIAITTGVQDGFAVMCVRDNGPGIEEEVKARLFTPFSTTKPEGLGLGLVISSDIVSELGGTLTVESAPSEGAAFTMRLPLAEPEAAAGEPSGNGGAQAAPLTTP